MNVRQQELHNIRQELWVLRKSYNVIYNTMEHRNHYVRDIADTQGDRVMALINRLTDMIDAEKEMNQ